MENNQQSVLNKLNKTKINEMFKNTKKVDIKQSISTILNTKISTNNFTKSTNATNTKNTNSTNNFKEASVSIFQLRKNEILSKSREKNHKVNQINSIINSTKITVQSNQSLQSGNSFQSIKSRNQSGEKEKKDEDHYLTTFKQNVDKLLKDKLSIKSKSIASLNSNALNKSISAVSTKDKKEHDREDKNKNEMSLQQIHNLQKNLKGNWKEIKLKQSKEEDYEEMRKKLNDLTEENNKLKSQLDQKNKDRTSFLKAFEVLKTINYIQQSQSFEVISNLKKQNLQLKEENATLRHLSQYFADKTYNLFIKLSDIVYFSKATENDQIEMNKEHIKSIAKLFKENLYMRKIVTEEPNITNNKDKISFDFLNKNSRNFKNDFESGNSCVKLEDVNPNKSFKLILDDLHNLKETNELISYDPNNFNNRELKKMTNENSNVKLHYKTPKNKK